MGIPRFYRYVSERYPLINQPISDVSLLPEFDCFYLDMNGIIHNCTHTDAADSELSTLGLSQQLHNIFTYLDRLITHIIKPKQLVYLAIDGVAPRAKLNQQRSRRFRAGMERVLAMEKERHRQIKLNEDDPAKHAAPVQRFDSNCITPGTQFLTELSHHLVWFVRYKMKTDPLWSRLEVYFSGAEVPGEGEHKISDFIRHRKMSEGYTPNMRHCMYGSDADLMLLGLMTHEPHFTLVREVVVWGARNQHKVTAKKIDEEQWQLVHLSLFREYLMMEMRVMAPLDGERMLDDFILLTYLLGNDFIPHSPTLEISEDAIPLLMRVYRELLDKYNGQYLTENGKLNNPKMLQDLFETIGAMEEEILVTRVIEEASRKGGKKHGGAYSERRATTRTHDVVEDDVSAALSLLNDDDDDAVPPLMDDDEDDDDDDIGISDDELKEKELLAALDGDETVQDALGREFDEHAVFFEALRGSASFQDTKWTYYERKFGLVRGDGNAHANKGLQQIKRAYMEALVWVLEYYFQGPPSWSWYYPYHYSPMISDLTNIAEILETITFDKEQDGPLRPFEQLMANLPSSSAHLVPEPYRFLMQSPLSPIKQFYPEKFEIDMEGKRNEWEGVNLLPFIDVALLKAAIAQYCPDHRLSAAERQRNTLQRLAVRIVHDPQNYDTVPSTMGRAPGFPDIVSCCTRIEPYELPKMKTGRFVSRLMPGVTLPLAGFPSLYTLALESVRMEHIRVNCFGMSSRKATLVLQLPPTPQPIEAAVDPAQLLGQTTLVNWPNLHEAKVVGISSLSGEYRLQGDAHIVFTPYDGEKKTEWASYAQSEVLRLLNGRGTPGSGGVDLGPYGITCILHVLPLQGMISNPITGAVEKKFGETEALVPLQLAVRDRQLYDARFAETAATALHERFPRDSIALITSGQWLGCTAVVQDWTPAKSTVTVHVNTIDKEPPFGYVIADQLSEKFHAGFAVAKRLGISTTTLGLLAGSVRVKPGDYEIGLNLRFRKDLLLPGYCRLVNKAAPAPGTKEENNVWRKGDIVQIVGSGVALNRDDRAQRQRENGTGSNTTWEYTDRTIALLAAYKAAFPEVVARLDKLAFATSYQASDIFGTKDKKKIESLAESIVSWVDAQDLGKKDHSKHVPITSQYIALHAMKAIEAAGALRAKERAKSAEAQRANPVVVEIRARDLFRPNPLVNQDLTGSEVAQRATKNPGAPLLGDRVINISARGVPFGQRGTVVATHVSSKCVEVLFDEGFTGGEPLYGSTSLNRGKIVPWNNVLCVSTPPSGRPGAPAASTVAETNKQRSSSASRGNKSTNNRSSSTPPTPSSAKGLAISTNYRQPRKPQPASTAQPEPVTVPVEPAPPVAVPTPPLPDPAKIDKLIKKWSHKGAGKAGAVPPSTSGVDERVVPSVAALFEAAAADLKAADEKETDKIAPSVAALFSAAAATPSSPPPPPAPPAPPAPTDLLASLFPHMADAAAPQPPTPSVPPYAMVTPMPPPPPSHLYPPQVFINPYAVPPHPIPVPQPMAPVPAEPASLAEFPPLSATKPGEVQTKKKAAPTVPQPEPTQATAKKSKTKYVPKAEVAKGDQQQVKTPSAKPSNLLLPSQVMRQQPKTVASAAASD